MHDYYLNRLTHTTYRMILAKKPPRRTFLMSYPHFNQLRQRNHRTSWKCFSVQIGICAWRTVCAGGLSANTSTLGFIEWLWTIYQFPVSYLLCLQWNAHWLYLLATSVDVERTFSQGRLLLSHVRSRLSVQSTRALLCVGVWSALGYVKDDDVKAAALLPEVNGKEEELAEDWDSI